MRGISLAPLALLLTLVPSGFAQESTWNDPAALWSTTGPPQGRLLIHGGKPGGDGADAFMALLGDPEAPIVVIPTAGGAQEYDIDDHHVRVLVERGARDVKVVHTRDRAVANSPEFVAPLRAAKGVWIAGGYQSYLAKTYLHTLTHRALFDVLARGGIIAGNSAGASIMGSYLYGGHAAGEVGFGFVRNTAIGQHYFRRRRLGGLARIIVNQPDLLGIGIDEETFIVVEGDGFQVLGRSKVALCNTRRPGWTEADPYQILLPGDRYDLKQRSVQRASEWRPDELWSGAGEPFPYPDWDSQGPPRGQLLLSGAQPRREILEAFLEAVGGASAPILIIPTATSVRGDVATSHPTLDLLRTLGADQAALWHTIDRRRANSPAFTAPLRRARGVWFCDGAPWILADAYHQTLAHLELFGVLERGGTVAGAGGGARFLASQMVGAGHGWKHGAALLPGVALHTWPAGGRDIQGIETSLAQSREFLGIGLDEQTAILVNGDRLKVLGGGMAAFFDPTIRGWPWPGEESFILLDRGTTFDLRTRRPDW